GRLIHKLKVKRSTNPGVTQRGWREITCRCLVTKFVGFLLVAHAIDDVTPGDDIVEGFEGVAGNLVLVVLHHVRLADAPELATTVVQLGLDDAPAVFIDIEATLAINVALTGYEVGLAFPDPMQHVASQVLIPEARLDDVAVLDVAGAD